MEAWAGVARVAGVLVLTGASIGLVWATTALPTICFAQYSVPTSNSVVPSASEPCSSANRVSTAAAATWMLVALGAACTIAWVATRPGRASRTVAALGGILAAATVLAPPFVVVQSGFAVDMLLLGIVVTALAIAGGIVGLTRRATESSTLDADP